VPLSSWCERSARPGRGWGAFAAQTMPRSRSRSRSRRGDDKKDRDRDRKDDKKDDPPPRKEGVAEAAKSGSSEQEIVSVAIRQLPGDIRERLEKLFEEGLLKEGDLDLRSITVFASLNEGLQARVMNHMENERIYVANARSKSGFLIATCDKAKTGCLDARGLGAIDPWRTALVAMATPKQKMIDLKPERDWLEQHDEGAAIKLHVNVAVVENELGVPSVTVELPLSETSAAVKAKLVAMGVKSIPANRMKLHTEPVGFLKEGHSFAFYNLSDGVTLALSERKRAGVRLRADHTAMPKRPRTQPQPGEATSPVDALQKLVSGGPAAKLPALPALPKLPGLGGTNPAALHTGGLPGLGLSLSMPSTSPSLAGSTAPGALGTLLSGIRPGGLPGGISLPGSLSLPGTGVAPGLGALGGLSLPKLGIDPKAGPPLGLMNLDLGKAKAPLLPDPKAPGLLPPLPLLPGMDPKSAPLLPPPGSDPKAAAAMAMMPKSAGPPGGPGGMPPLGGLGGMPPPGGPGGMPPPGGLPPPLSMPGLGGMTKAPSGLPGGPAGGLPSGLPPGGMPGGLLPPPGSGPFPGGPLSGPPGGMPDMSMPPMDGAAPKVQSKSQMPAMSGSIPKLPMGGSGMPPPGLGMPPVNEAVAAATAKAAPA